LDSAGVGALIAEVAFWALLIVGFWIGELSPRGCAVVLALWLAALFSGAYRPFWLPFSTCVAVLDVALVLIVAKGDVRLS